MVPEVRQCPCGTTFADHARPTVDCRAHEEQPVDTYKSLADSPVGYQWMSIDTQGGLRFHPSRPRRLTVNAPLDLLSMPAGYVYAEEMIFGLTYDGNADSFSGNL